MPALIVSEKDAMNMKKCLAMIATILCLIPLPAATQIFSWDP